MTHHQTQAIARVRQAALTVAQRQFTGYAETEIKSEQVMEHAKSVSIAVSAGLIGDEATSWRMYSRVFGSFLIGPRGKIQACMYGQHGIRTKVRTRPLANGWTTLRGKQAL